jgi:hypothetical protein
MGQLIQKRLAPEKQKQKQENKNNHTYLLTMYIGIRGIEFVLIEIQGDQMRL